MRIWHPRVNQTPFEMQLGIILINLTGPDQGMHNYFTTAMAIQRFFFFLHDTFEYKV